MAVTRNILRRFSSADLIRPIWDVSALALVSESTDGLITTDLSSSDETTLELTVPSASRATALGSVIARSGSGALFVAVAVNELCDADAELAEVFMAVPSLARDGTGDAEGEAAGREDLEVARGFPERSDSSNSESLSMSWFNGSSLRISISLTRPTSNW
jgi:hypothetical protein